ncbi:hypothetical protein BDN72DRAFT_883421 [Pluteus cervinus]|uniref:Uncharacterized protein n=1 Tax=Pluteus cervinus TaxID=181527 RepID=A0ACD3A5F2_9AGAR|nr:hypothetical protein BDN72DRAFT_883421 [Pluteus cervinus]
MPNTTQRRDAWGDPIQSPVDAKHKAYGQSYGDTNLPYNSFPSSPIEDGMEHHLASHEESRPFVSNASYTTYIPNPASPDVADSSSLDSATSPPPHLPLATTTSNRHFLEEQIAPAPGYTSESPSTNNLPLQSQGGIHHSTRVISPPPHTHPHCTTPTQVGHSSDWTIHRTHSPSLLLSPGLQAEHTQEKKPPLACLFCRGRKIACGPPIPGSKDKTCNQCQRRSLKCEYPSES